MEREEERIKQAKSTSIHKTSENPEEFRQI